MRTASLVATIVLGTVLAAYAQIGWQDIEVVNFESEVSDLIKLGMVTSKAKGMTVYSSQGKMQTRAINKLKMMSAMMGASTVLILNQQTQSAQYGGWYGGTSTTAGANISGIAYTSTRPEPDHFQEGIYIPMKAYYMGPNHTGIKETMSVELKKPVTLTKEHINEDQKGIELNQYFKLGGNLNARTWDIVNIEDDMIRLHAIHRTGGSKETHMAIILHSLGEIQ